jgi:hypothetical protein
VTPTFEVNLFVVAPAGSQLQALRRVMHGLQSLQADRGDVRSIVHGTCLQLFQRKLVCAVTCGCIHRNHDVQGQTPSHSRFRFNSLVSQSQVWCRRMVLGTPHG